MTKELAIQYIEQYRDDYTIKYNVGTEKPSSLYPGRLTDIMYNSYLELVTDNVIKRIRESNKNPLEVVDDLSFWFTSVDTDCSFSGTFHVFLQNTLDDLYRYLDSKEHEYLRFLRSVKEATQ